MPPIRQPYQQSRCPLPKTPTNCPRIASKCRGIRAYEATLAQRDQGWIACGTMLGSGGRARKVVTDGVSEKKW
jgi:hypothetical protein